MFDLLNFLDFIRLSIAIPLKISPSGEIDGDLAKRAVKKEVYLFDEYFPTREEYYRKMSEVTPITHRRIVDAMCLRIYARRDGALMLLFGEASTVVILHFDEPIWKLLGFESFEELDRTLDWHRVMRFMWEIGFFKEAVTKFDDMVMDIKTFSRRDIDFINSYEATKIVNNKLSIDTVSNPLAILVYSYFLMFELGDYQRKIGESLCRFVGIRSSEPEVRIGNVIHSYSDKDILC